MKNQLPRLPQISKSTTRAWGKCACGCGGGTQSTFVPGHDARQKGIIIRLVRGVMTEADIAEWGGEAVLVATMKAMDDKGRMERWNLTDEVAAYKAEVARLEAEAKAEAEKAS